ncbi:TPA: endonuclease/exonuclease/phosphatase family protein [Klebsiella variicola]
MAEDIVSLAWWNTSISPSSARGRASNDELLFAFSLIAKLIDSYSVDIFCLGEVSPSDVSDLNGFFGNVGYYVYDGTYNDGRVKHDLCVLINLNKFAYIDSKSIMEQSPLGKIRAGQELQLLHISSGDDLFLYISHWPSRSYDASEGMPKRLALGNALRNAMERCINDRKGKYFILAGDYNDEPFNHSMTHALFASRDRELVSRNNGLLYNPFWRLLGAALHYDNACNDSCAFGTYYYKSGTLTRWYTFDQIMFSSSFLNGDKWILLEERIKIINDDSISNLILSNSTNFDHLPVLASVKRI